MKIQVTAGDRLTWQTDDLVSIDDMDSEIEEYEEHFDGEGDDTELTLIGGTMLEKEVFEAYSGKGWCDQDMIRLMRQIAGNDRHAAEALLIAQSNYCDDFGEFIGQVDNDEHDSYDGVVVSGQGDTSEQAQIECLIRRHQGIDDVVVIDYEAMVKRGTDKPPVLRETATGKWVAADFQYDHSNNG